MRRRAPLCWEVPWDFSTHVLGLGSCSLMLAHKQQQHHTDLPSPASLLSQTPERKHLSGETPQGDWSRLEQRRQRRSRWSRWSRWDRGIFHSVLKTQTQIQILIIYSCNKVKLCEYICFYLSKLWTPQKFGRFTQFKNLALWENDPVRWIFEHLKHLKRSSLLKKPCFLSINILLPFP